MTVGVLLGPQRLAPIVGEAVEMLKIDGKIAAITAGWQEREAEDQELCDALGTTSVNLMLHARGEAVFRDDPDFFAAHRAKQDRLRHLHAARRCGGVRLGSHRGNGRPAGAAHAVGVGHLDPRRADH